MSLVGVGVIIIGVYLCVLSRLLECTCGLALGRHNGPAPPALPLSLMCRRPPMDEIASGGLEDVDDSLREASARLLTHALRRVLQQLHESDEVAQFVSEACLSFASYSPTGEHMLEWTQWHNLYCTLVDNAIQTELQVLGCSEEALLHHAVHSDEPPSGPLGRLLALTDYVTFCEMMHAEACDVHGDTFTHNDGAEYEYTEVEEEAGDEDPEEDEGLEQALATLRLQAEVDNSMRPIAHDREGRQRW